MKISGRQRKGISPIVATVLIIAATLIAFAAVLGYIFGIFGGAGSTANVSVTSVSLSHSCMVAAPAITCTLSLTNTGSSSATTTGGTITFGGTTYTWTSASTPIAADSAAHTVVLTATSATSASAGQAFTGVVSLTNGEQALFSGTFS